MRDAAAWVGQRIRGMRQAAHLSQAQLAEAIGTQQATVSQWENGKRTPGLDEVIALADALRVSAVQLLPPRQAPTPTATLLRAHIQAGDELEVHDALDEVSARLERLHPIPATISVPADRPIRAAQQLLSRAQAHGLGGDWVEINKVTQLCGVHVVEMDFPDALSGVLAKQDDLALIAIGRNQNQGRRRFAVAHELGHHLLRHYEYFHLDLVGPSNELGDAPTFDWRLEREANDFAANVLMPSGRVRQLAAEEIATREMAQSFGVNPIAMRYRLRALELDDASAKP